jgi:hypothetical protein
MTVQAGRFFGGKSGICYGLVLVLIRVDAGSAGDAEENYGDNLQE